MSIGACAWDKGDAGDACGDTDVVCRLEILTLVGDGRHPGEETVIADFCEEHVGWMLRLDAAHPLFWQVERAELL